MSSASILGSIARLALPRRAFERLRAVRSRRHQVQLFKDWGITEATKHYVERNGCVVRHGPFAGMIYPTEAALDRHSIPKLLGTYELELHETIASIALRKYDCVIDIGSAEGYYAVGLARLLRVPVFAFDPEPGEKQLCGRMAELNGVSNFVELAELFTAKQFSQFLDRRALVICDCEGFEEQLFTDATVPLTSTWDLIIELHGSTNQSLPLRSWPQSTSVKPAEERDNLRRYSELDGLGSHNALLSEYRSISQSWLLCDSRLP
jgi:hypothetical protein